MNVPPRPLYRRLRLTLTLAALAAAIALPAQAQWAWRDANGRTVYSDQPPPPSVKKEQILRTPGRSIISTVQPAAAPSPAPVAADKTAPAAPKTLAERDQEFRKRQQERADAEKKQADEQANAQRHQQDCNRLRGYLRQLEDGVRIARSDADGNRELIDDATRASEITRLRGLLQSSGCDR